MRLWPLRDFADDAYRRVDDRPYGGGPGMVMLAEPLLRALAAVRAERGEARPAPVVHFTPTGRRLDQALVQRVRRRPGRGAAVRPLRRHRPALHRRATSTHELSLGDFVLSGGELPALALLDAVARLQAGVLHAPSHQQDSFSDGLLEGPHYSRPETLATPAARSAGAAGAAVGPPRRDRALAARAVAGADGAAPARPDRRGAGRRAADARPTSAFLASLGL